MKIEIIGKFFDNHSLSIINREIATRLSDKFDVYITPVDPFSNQAKMPIDKLKQLKNLSEKELNVPDIQVRHVYPPIWNWPIDRKTKVVYIQPWEWEKIPFEWQHKFETFADALIVPSNWEKALFSKAGLNPNKLFSVANGYDDKLFNKLKGNAFEGVDPDKFNFIYVGCSQHRKGLDIVLNAWKDTFTRADKARLILKDTPKIYGASNILNETIRIQYTHNCAPIHYIDDDLSAEQMADLYKASKVIVHPYRAEGFGMPVQEALACGCLPIVPSGGPTDEFVGEVAYKIPVERKTFDIHDPKFFAFKPGDAGTHMNSHAFYNEPHLESFKNLLRKIYMNHQKEKEFKKVREHNCKNTWSNVIPEYEKVFETIHNFPSTQRVDKTVK